MDVISEMMGVPPADRGEVRRLADLLVHREAGVHDVPPAGVAAALTLVGYYSDMLASRRRQRTDDLTSALLDADIDGDRLTDDEIIGFLFLMVVAGNETTTKLLGNAWYWAWRNPDQQRRALGNNDLIPSWIEETLRYDTSSQMLARVTTTDVELHGTTIPAGDRVLLLVGSANRDERVFADADRYDLARPLPQQQLLSFGFGRHYCLGASLARLEGQIALPTIARRFPNLRLAREPVYREHVVLRGLAELRVSA
jgi:hypothetical protein